MTTRFKNAHQIWDGGASNPRAVVRALTRAIDEAVEQGGGSSSAADPAVQMILDQLCFLCGMPEPSLEMSPEQWRKIADAVSVGVDREKTTEEH